MAARKAGDQVKAAIQAYLAGGGTVAEVAREYKLSRPTLYRQLRAYKAENGGGEEPAQKAAPARDENLREENRKLRAKVKSLLDIIERL